MPVLNSIAPLIGPVTEWRRHIHAHPELMYEVHQTAAFVADKLRDFGCDEVVEGIGRTGVVGVIKGRSDSAGRVVGLRADMDALPLEEITGLPYASTVPGRMHACGHDGHTAMLLGAAAHLAATRNFDGTVIVIFQPAEEGGAGGKAMVEDGLMTRWNIGEVYGLHNAPGRALGTFAIRPGPMLAAADQFYIKIQGRGGHAARPHLAIDPILVGSHLVAALQSVVARNIDPLGNGVVSVCKFQSGHTTNVIPDTAELAGTCRSLTNEIRDLLEEKVTAVVQGTAAQFGAEIDLDYQRDYPVTRNHEAQTAFAAEVAADVAGSDHVITDPPPVMGGEDFAFMLEARPGAFMMLGNGDTAPVHHPAYDFNDAVIPYGISYWVRLAERAMPLS
jgi:amidohydrolase